MVEGDGLRGLGLVDLDDDRPESDLGVDRAEGPALEVVADRLRLVAVEFAAVSRDADDLDAGPLMLGVEGPGVVVEVDLHGAGEVEEPVADAMKNCHVRVSCCASMG
jgi:hypothetical protein